MFAIIAAAAAAAQMPSFYDGNKLWDFCSGDKSSPVYYQQAEGCRAYIIGVYDTQVEFRRATPTVCISMQVESQQLVDVVKQWLERNPANRQHSASSIVLYALGQAFPCGK